MRSPRLLQDDATRNCHVRLGRHLSRKPLTDSKGEWLLAVACYNKLVNRADRLVHLVDYADASDLSHCRDSDGAISPSRRGAGQCPKFVQTGIDTHRDQFR